MEINWFSCYQIILIILSSCHFYFCATIKPTNFDDERFKLNNSNSSQRNATRARLKLELKNCGLNQMKDLSSKLRIIGGREVVKGNWPWQVALLNHFREPFCGGTLITPSFVLTAAHCVRRRLYIRAGEHDLMTNEGTEQEVKVDHVFIHPSFDRETVDSDVALLRLKVPFKLGKFVATACLPSRKDEIPIDSFGTILGWGKKKNSALFGTDVLHQARVPIVNISECRNVYEDYFISNNMFCAGYRSGRVDSCAGDSGGPLLFQKRSRWYIYGITSFGEGCGRREKYGIYAKVPNFVKWIRRVIHKHSYR
ncbi:trypsin-3-like [Panonychus citri]|uniref:trypsin-3-like n=1 Tax=Panonychus citri TaxID=50023 RepID=UPI002307881F|nr:trypsin-3-like [Panonychus citri]